MVTIGTDSAPDRACRSPVGHEVLSHGRRAKRGSRRDHRWLAIAVASLLTTGCSLAQWAHNGFEVGPDYAPPPAPVASEWIDATDPRIKSEPAQLAEWWQVFN